MNGIYVSARQPVRTHACGGVSNAGLPYAINTRLGRGKPQAYLEGLEVGLRGFLVPTQRLQHERHVAQSAAVHAVSPSEVVIHLVH